MQIIPLQAVPNQTLRVLLDGQATQINLYQKATGLFIDVLVNDVLIAGGVICENLNRVIRYLYEGFSGDLAFIDSLTGSDGVGTDPVYTGLGTRYSLAYIEPDELLPNEG